MWFIETVLRVRSVRRLLSSRISPIVMPIIPNQPGFLIESHGHMMDFPQACNG